MLRMHKDFFLMALNGSNDVIVYKNPETRKKFVYCMPCGNQTELNEKRIKGHTKQCVSKFEPLCQNNLIPNGLTSAYKNLHGHIFNGDELVAKEWPYRRPTRTLAR